MSMKLSQFNYKVPDNLIALRPKETRSDSRLLVANRETGTIEHRTFRDILDYFDEGDTFVMNDSLVFPARLYGKKEKTNAEIEVFMLRELNNQSRLWDVVVDPARKIRVGNKLYFGDNELVAEVVDNTTSRGRTIRFLFDGTDEEFNALIDHLGTTPIPDYIRFKRKEEPADAENYQTIYAKNKGSVAAPDAGLHFDLEMMKRLELQGVEFAYVTLHTGLGSFREVEVEDLSKHKMDSEYFFVTPEEAEVVNRAKKKRKKVCAVGATTMRAIESSVSANKLLNANAGWTDRFIFPPYTFSIANCYLTNLHPPRSTMVMLVAAFMDYEFAMEAYQQAIKEKYRFYVYGDAMLIL